MRQTKYLFIGGPCGGRWERAYGNDNVYRAVVPAPTPADPFATRTMLYFRREVEAAAWIVPIVVYANDPVLTAPTGAPMPGWISGVRPDTSPCGPWRYLDNDERYRGEAMHAAIRARGCRP